jgi:hypothetical protein
MGSGSRKCKLSYPGHALSPSDLLHFIEMGSFSKDWASFGFDIERDLLALQISIMANPKGPPVLEGTGGLRKIRFAPSIGNIGKSKGVRVCYAFFELYGIVLLITVYSHKEKDNLTATEKRQIKKLLEEAEAFFSERRYS